MPFNKQRRKRGNFFFFPLMFIVMMLLLGAIVMFLWNAILPSISPAKEINYWQATGLLVLCRILFGSFRRGFGPPGGGMHRRSPWREKWMNMSPEEREKFRNAWKDKCSQQKK